MIKLVIAMFAILLLSCTLETGRTEKDILADVALNFIYIPDVVGKDKWETFAEVNESWAGDCEDAVTLYMGLVYRETGTKLSVEVYQYGDRYHATVRTDLVDYPLTSFNPERVLNDVWVLKCVIGYDLWMLGTYVK